MQTELIYRNRSYSKEPLLDSIPHLADFRECVTFLVEENSSFCLVDFSSSCLVQLLWIYLLMKRQERGRCFTHVKQINILKYHPHPFVLNILTINFRMCKLYFMFLPNFAPYLQGRRFFPTSFQRPASRTNKQRIERRICARISLYPVGDDERR